MFRGVYLEPCPPWHQIKIILLVLFIFKLSEYEDVSIINMIQVKFSSFLRRIVSCCKGGGGKLSRAVYHAPPTHPDIEVKFVLLI